SSNNNLSSSLVFSKNLTSFSYILSILVSPPYIYNYIILEVGYQDKRRFLLSFFVGKFKYQGINTHVKGVMPWLGSQNMKRMLNPTWN
ncbi:MAG: hypothetical protein ACRC1D_01910, partial [Culicoidibacterales bacterium]